MEQHNKSEIKMQVFFEWQLKNNATHEKLLKQILIAMMECALYESYDL